MSAKAKQEQTGFRNIFASLIAPTLRMSHLQKFLLFGLKRHCLSGCIFGTKYSFCYLNTTSLEWEAGETSRSNDFLSADEGRYEGKHHFNKLVGGYCAHFWVYFDQKELARMILS